MIEVSNLKKKYKVPLKAKGLREQFKRLFTPSFTEVEALKGISLHMKKGELVGYIGPNGAGKSTTIKILSGILVPEEGQVLINGMTPWLDRKAYVQQIGVVFGQKSQLWWDLPVIDSFSLLRDIYKIPEEKYQENLASLAKLMDIEGFMNQPVRQLSLGQKMRCELVASLLHDPILLFLDEPTIGLDANSKLAMRSFIKKINEERQVTVILTTHDMDDIEALCERVIVIGQGLILYDGKIEGLKKKVEHEQELLVDLQEGHIESSLPHVDLVKEGEFRYRFRYDPQVISSGELIHHIANEAKIKDVLVKSPSIEEIIAHFYGDHVS